MINWKEIAQMGFDDKRRQAHGMTTGKELFRKAFEQMQEDSLKKAQLENLEAQVKSKLLQAMISRTPFKVLKSFHNATETLNGLTKSNDDDDDDGFYSNVGSSSSTENSKFQETMEVIPAGITLTFKNLEKSLGTLVFKGSDGFEYVIYKDPSIMFKGSQIKNPGYYGLLFNTDLNN